MTDGGRDVPPVPDDAEYAVDYFTADERAGDFADLREGDRVDVVYEPNRGKAPSKSKTGVVTYVNRRDDDTVRSVNVDTGDEYDDGTPKTFEFPASIHGRPVIKSHGRKRTTRIGRVNRVVVTDTVDTDETDQPTAVTDGGTSVDDFETTKADVADAVRATDDATLWEAFGRETQTRVCDVEVGRYAAVAYTLSVDAYAAGADLSRCVVPAVVWGVTDKAYAYDRLGDVYDAVVVFHTGAAGPYVDGIRKKVADAIDPDVVVTEPIADPETVDDGEPVTDGGTDVEAETVYVIDGAHETTSAAKAERARSNGRRVTAKSRLR